MAFHTSKGIFQKGWLVRQMRMHLNINASTTKASGMKQIHFRAGTCGPLLAGNVKRYAWVPEQCYFGAQIRLVILVQIRTDVTCHMCRV